MPSGKVGDTQVFLGNLSKEAATKIATYSLSGGTNITQIGGETIVADNGAGTTVTKMLPIGGKYNSSLPTYTNGDMAMLQLDANGKLLVAQSADIEIGAVEIKDGTTDARQAIKVDNATASATPSIGLVGGIYKDSLDTYDDNDAVPFHFDERGRLQTTGGVSIPPYTHSSARQDFTATYTSNVTITLAGEPATVTNEQISSITITDTAGTTTQTFVNGVGGVAMSISSHVITITGAGTPFTSGDTYDVRLNLFNKAYDTSLDILKIIEQSPLWSRYTSVSADLLSGTPYELTASFADVCAEVETIGYNYVTWWFTIDIGSSTDVQLRFLHKHTSAGSEEYREIYLGVSGNPAPNITTINLNDYEIASDADQLFKITLPVTGSRYIQLQAKDATNGDGQIDALYVTKDWGA